ncbi:MAG: type II toxin-antitoxin system VapC family toxin [Elusimicrobiota bacterium]
MTKFLIDTDVLIEILRGNIKILSCFDTLNKKGATFFYSPVTKAEIFHGIREKEEPKINLLFQSMECIFINDEIGRKAGLYLKEFHRSHNVQLGDSLIAASAYFADTILFTLNRKHYPMKDIKVFAD